MNGPKTPNSSFSASRPRKREHAGTLANGAPSVRPPQKATVPPARTFESLRSAGTFDAELSRSHVSSELPESEMLDREAGRASETGLILVEPNAPSETPTFRENWLERNGHTATYAGIFLFTLVLYFRPYELIPALSGFNSMALLVAIATLLIFIPSQITTEGNITAFPIEVKCILFITAWALLGIPISRSPSLAWATFNDTFIKVVLIFIVMVNTLRTERRIKGLMWLGIAVGIMLSFQAVDLYMEGVFHTEGYRVSVDFGGMFGNPNDMSVHLVIFIPIALTLGVATRNWLLKGVFFAGAGVMTTGCLVTQSRGAFLGLIAVAVVLVWKLGRRQRVRTMLIASAIGLSIILLAPGNYGLRILSIFIPSLDPVGSASQRTELLIRSVLVTLRNPLGIGIGNFEIVGVFNLGTHNAFTQVSSELGWLAFIAYLVVLLSPIRKLDIIERRLFSRGDASWLYYLSIGVQASIAGYFVSSFFASLAYNWYVYYPVAYAIGMRRIYQVEYEKGIEHPAAQGKGALEIQTA